MANEYDQLDIIILYIATIYREESKKDGGGKGVEKGRGAERK